MSRPVAIALSLVALLVVIWLWRGSSPPPAPDARASRPTSASMERHADRPGSGTHGETGAAAPAGARRERMEGAAPQVKLRPAPFPTLRREGTEEKKPVDPADDAELQKMIHAATEDPNPSERANAISDLALRDDVENVLPALRQAAKDPDPDVKLAMVTALGEMGEAAPIDLVAQYASDGDPEIRLEALSVVEGLVEEEGTRDAVAPILNKARHDPDEEVRDKANEIVEQMSEDSSGEE